MKRVFDPETKERAGSKPRVLICDGFGTHETVEILEFCFAHNIYLCRLPSHTSHKLQPCDVAVFAPLKAAYRDNVERLERAGVGMIGKQHFTSLYSPARKLAFSRRNILAAWGKAGLFPFNPDRVLRDLPKPSSQPSTTDTTEGRGLVHDTVPPTPLTPVSVEALISLQTKIVQDACTLDKKSKQDLERHLQKLTKAAGTFHAKSALQQDQISFLLKSNNESKARRATKSLVLGKAKVMSYDDLVAARAIRAEREAAKEAVKERKAKKGRRRGISRAQTEEERVQISDTLCSGGAHTTVQISSIGQQEEERSVEVIPFRAPVARMY
jgi:hypothetical protein